MVQAISPCRLLVLAAFCGFVLAPRLAAAEGGALGAGIRFSFVRGSVDAEPSQRYSGGHLRLRMSPRSALELSLDYRSALNDTLKLKVKDYPIQASMLLYPVRARLSPYVLGGFGWYSQRVDTLDTTSVVQKSTTTRKVGYHAGLGGEIQLGSRAALHLDYRYTFIHVGRDEGTNSGAFPLPGLGGLQEKLKLSHDGSMWTTGLTVYF